MLAFRGAFAHILLLCALLTTSARALQIAPPGAVDPGQLNEARAAIGNGHWLAADRLLRSYLTAQPGSAEALYLLARTLLRENRPKESLQIFTEAAKGETPSALDFRYVALDYVLLHDYADADTWITRSAKAGSSDAETWYDMGRIKYTENRFREAVDSFLKALALQPHSVKAENNLGLAFEGLNQPDEAVRAYRQAIAWQGSAERPSEQPFLNLGILLTNRNALAEALPLLERARTLAPADTKVHAALGTLYARQLAFPQAQKEFEQAVAAEPNNPALHFQLGQVYRREGLTQRSKEELARAAALEGTHSSDGGMMD